jgi:DNA-3-methyladenine glycosylase II
VACQQLSLDAGLTVLGRLVAAAGPNGSELLPFPAPEDVLRLPTPTLRELGLSYRKAETILQLARAAAGGELDLGRFEPLSDGEVVAALVARPGIGRLYFHLLLRGLENRGRLTL